MGVLIEHLGGAFPLWLAPVQAVIVPITDRNVAYANSVRDKLSERGLRVEVNDSGDRMNAKLRTAQLQKIPYMLVVGDREEEDNVVAVRTRAGGNLGTVPVEEVVASLSDESEQRSLKPLMTAE